MSQEPSIRSDILDSGSLQPKKDKDGRMYREVRCPKCHAWLCDEYVRQGRLRFKCFRCGRIIVMVFRPFRPEKVEPEKKLKQEGNPHHGSK